MYNVEYTSLCIRGVWSEFLLGAFWIASDAKFLHANIKNSDQTAQMCRLIWVSLVEGMFLTLQLN